MHHFIDITVYQDFTTIGSNNAFNLKSGDVPVYLMSININMFDSRQGKSVYYLFLFITLILWIACFMVNPISVVASFTLIPFIFFTFGKSYFKHKNDNYHLKIHKILMNTVVATSVLSFLILILSLLKLPFNFSGLSTIIITVNLLSSYGLYFNSLGEDNVIDFIINVFKWLFRKFKKLIF